jgi:hypothetical protein
VQGGIAQLHLGFDALEPNRRQVSGRIDQGIEQRRLTDSGLTAEDDGSTQTTAHLLQERIQLRGLLAPPDQHVSP